MALPQVAGAACLSGEAVRRLAAELSIISGSARRSPDIAHCCWAVSEDPRTEIFERVRYLVPCPKQHNTPKTSQPPPKTTTRTTLACGVASHRLPTCQSMFSANGSHHFLLILSICRGKGIPEEAVATLKSAGAGRTASPTSCCTTARSTRRARRGRCRPRRTWASRPSCATCSGSRQARSPR